MRHFPGRKRLERHLLIGCGVPGSGTQVSLRVFETYEMDPHLFQNRHLGGGVPSSSHSIKIQLLDRLLNFGVAAAKLQAAD